MTNLEVYNSLLKTENILQRNYKNVAVGISGGSDSDILIELCEMFKKENVNMTYVFFDTGMEYEATKKHLKYLEEKYKIKIEKVKAIKPIPLAVKEYGVPFMSKIVSEYISRLQSHGFKWEDKSFDELHKFYPKCKSALLWWCNEAGENSSFNIKRNKYLKEFMIKNPPTFPISNKCCSWSKKKPAEKFYKENNFDLIIIGVRKAEGGIRATNYRNCFTDGIDRHSDYRPIFYYKDEDKQYFNSFFEIRNSDCYTKYGLKRTGCVGCPYGKNFDFELEVVDKFEPKLSIAVRNIFKDSYEYHRKYLKFKKNKEEVLDKQ